MAYENAKQLLAQACTEIERDDAIRQAILAGMPLNQIEEYLDQLDFAGPMPLTGAEEADVDRGIVRYQEESRHTDQDAEKGVVAQFHLIHPPQWLHSFAAKAAALLAAAVGKKNPQDKADRQ